MIALKLLFVYILIRIHQSLADVIILRPITDKVIEQFHDLPAQFGAVIPPEGLKYLAYEARPKDGCNPINPPDDDQLILLHQKIVVIARNNCTFEEKIRNAQKAGYDAAIVYNVDSNELERMSAKHGEDILIPSVFVGYTSGLLIVQEYLYNSDYIIFIKEDNPFNINTHLIIPFSILVGLCFIIMIVYMVYKCAREQRRLRRHRLPKKLLKKIPTIKFGKSQPYETCAICLEDYVEGEKLRVLPCAHAYHCQCIDTWLTKNRRVCPICKRKVFIRGESRNTRRRNNLSDSMSDSETDDTTPLINPVENSNNHGTFSNGRRQNQDNNDERATTDDENVLLRDNAINQQSGRINPFDRVPNLPPNLLGELNNRNSFWSVFRRYFRGRPSSQQIETITNTIPQPVQHGYNESIAANPTPIPSSNNLLNTNLSGSFKENESDQSIYESVTSMNNQQQPDSVFIQTPTQGGLGVVALPNTNFNTTATTNNNNNNNSTSNRRQSQHTRNFMV